jgi:hypothetical protein
LRLLGEKQAAIDTAVAQTYADFEAALSAMKVAQGEFNASERGHWKDHVIACRAAFVAAVQANDAKMADIISTRRASLNAALAEQARLMQEAMDADRAEMKRLLKEIYNYNTHDLDAAAASDGSAAPWSVEQHNGFMAKLHYWSKEQLSGKDAQLANFRDEYAALSASSLEQAQAESLTAQRQVEDQRDAASTRINRMVEDCIELLGEFAGANLGLLQEDRAASEAFVASAIEGFRKQAIYSLHVVRYGGGYDAEQTGFGEGASSFYGRGNALTGVDELDEFRLGNPHGYAQVADKHTDDLEDALEAARDGVADTVAQARLDERASVDAFKAAVRAEADRLLQLVTDTGAALLGEQADLVASVEGSMAFANGLRMALLGGLTDTLVGQGEAICDTNLDKINAWIADRLAWAAKMPDSYRKKHLVQELEATLARLTGEFEARRTEMKSDAQAALDALRGALDGVASDLAASNDDATAALTATVGGAVADMAAGGDDISAGFDADAEAEFAGFSDQMDADLQQWAYWLKYVYGYQGYDQSIYQDFDPSQDYSDIYGYPSGDGAYSDLGTQGPDLGNSGVANLPAGGYGVGGRGGVDYIYSGDSAAEAYGKFIGPSKEFFQTSILDPIDQEQALIADMLSHYQ